MRRLLLYFHGFVIALLAFINLLIASYHVHFHLQTDHKSQISPLAKAAIGATTKITTSVEEVRPKRRMPYVRPPLSSLVQGNNIIKDADVSWLLDFAIVGFPKCGTSSLMHFFKTHHSQVDIFTKERCDLTNNKQAILVRDLYKNLSSKPEVHRGIKCPVNLENTIWSLPRYRDYFPHTKFIVGIRHPVLWFESFYNFRIQNGAQMPPPETLIRGCHNGNYFVCTFRANFHIFLANLGKTRVLQDPQELAWFDPALRHKIRPDADGHRHRPFFLYDVSQLRQNTTSSQFLLDLQHFLDLEKPFDRNDMIWFRPGKKYSDKKYLDELNSRKIDICNSKYNPLRKLLMEQAKNVSHWIAQYFVHAPNVTVSSPDYLVKQILLKDWQLDPCLQRHLPKVVS